MYLYKCMISIYLSLSLYIYIYIYIIHAYREPFRVRARAVWTNMLKYMEIHITINPL